MKKSIVKQIVTFYFKSFNSYTQGSMYADRSGYRYPFFVIRYPDKSRLAEALLGYVFMDIHASKKLDKIIPFEVIRFYVGLCVCVQMSISSTFLCTNFS